MGWQKTPNFKERVEASSLKQIRQLSMRVLRGVIIRTPVDTGRLRGNWQVGINYLPSTALIEKDKNGMKTIRKGKGILDTIDMDTMSIWIANNLVYAKRIEDGHGGKNPGVMIASTLAVLKLS